MMENLRLRRARDDDLVEMGYIHYSSFPEMGGSPEERRERLLNNPLVPLENYWVATVNHQVIGMFAQYHFRIGRGEQTLPAVGIVSVGVAPNFRRRGVAHFMMTQALEIMEHNGVPLSILYPFRLPFYRKLGWGIVTRATLYKLNPQQIGNGTINGEIELVRREDQKEEVRILYDHMAHQGLSLIVRDPVHWEEMVFPRGVTYLYRSPHGKVEGYIIISYLPLDGEERWV
ncbi:MAG: enhanced intracellular survival protein Eis, partial [bacterium]